MSVISRLSVALTTDPKGFQKGLATATRAMDGFQKRTLALTGAVGAIGGIGVGFLANDLIDVNAKFQTLMSSLKTVTGGAKEADTAFALISDFAKSTPFNLDQVVESFIKLKALGLDPSQRALTSYGNTASAMGKSLNQMIEAVADASTGEFERLKEFGITAKSQKDEVTFTFQGVETTVKKTSEAIQGYLLNIGETNFAGAMSDQMGNLNTAFSNFQGAVELLQKTIGEAGINDIIVDWTKATTLWIESLDKEKIQEFVKESLLGFADIVDATASVTEYIEERPYLLETGLMGYILFGKKGVALIALAQGFMDSVSKFYENLGTEALGPGVNLEQRIETLKKEADFLKLQSDFFMGAEVYTKQLEAVNEEIRRLTAILPAVAPTGEFVPSAHLGDPESFAEWSRAYREQFKEEKEQTGLLRDIADGLRKQVATAG